MSGASVTIALSELARLAIPGLPTTDRGLRMRAEALGWERVRRAGRGGGFAYVVTGSVAEAVLAKNASHPVASNDIRRPVGRPKGSDFFARNPAIADAVEAILAHQQLAAPRVRELLETKFAELPDLRTLQRFVRRIEDTKAALLASTRDPDRYRAQYQLALGNAGGDTTHAHQFWELDTTPADVHLTDGRWAILGVIDRWSRRARFLVAPCESGQSVRRLLADTMSAWGVMPECVITDNGSGYINASIAASLETLGIEHRKAPPGSPWKKPFVERVFGTFTRERAELLPGFAGHNVADAQKLRARAKKATGRAVITASMSSAELQAVLDAWVDGVYHQRRHGSLNQSPMQRWQASPVPAAAAPGRDQLLIALSAVVGARKVGKKGLVWKGGSYWSAALVPWVGRTVFVRRDEDDLGALYVFSPDGIFIDTAVDHGRAGFSEQAFAMIATRQQREWMTEQRADLRAKKRGFDIDTARDAMLRRDAEAAGKLVSFPRPTVERTTASLDSLAAPPAPSLPSEAELARAERRAAPIVARIVPVAEKVAAADALIFAAASGEPVDAAELACARAYASSTEYRVEKMIAADFATPDRQEKMG
jgi:transposase InsO family protein